MRVAALGLRMLVVDPAPLPRDSLIAWPLQRCILERRVGTGQGQSVLQLARRSKDTEWICC